jgi:anti-anti-sigma factor
VTVAEEPSTLTLRIEGKVAGVTVDELCQAWRKISSKLAGRNVVIDLRDIIFIDRTGLAVLADIHRQTGAKFEATSPLTQYFAEQAMKIESQNGTSKGA